MWRTTTGRPYRLLEAVISLITLSQKISPIPAETPRIGVVLSDSNTEYRTQPFNRLLRTFLRLRKGKRHTEL